MAGKTVTTRKTVFVRDFYYNAADDRFVKLEEEILPVRYRKVLTSYKFKWPKQFLETTTFDTTKKPLPFCTTPETLINLSIKIAEKIPLSKVYTWNVEQVCRWLRRTGYPQYQAAFRINLINGRKLLLLDASALSEMNVKDFDHIRRITYGIRCLFHYELTNFSRSIALPPEYMPELYKLFRVKTGRNYETSRASDLWRRLQIIRPLKGYKEHWELLESWLKFEHDDVERFGHIHRQELYKCGKKVEKVVGTEEQCSYKICQCMPPCECFWTKRHTQMPWRLNSVPDENYIDLPVESNVLSVLLRTFPERYNHRSINYLLSELSLLRK